MDVETPESTFHALHLSQATHTPISELLYEFPCHWSQSNLNNNQEYSQLLEDVDKKNWSGVDWFGVPGQ